MASAAARAGVGGGALLTLQVEDIDVEVGCDVPLCAVKAPAVALELKMRREGNNEVLQQWELPEEESEEESSSSLLKKLQIGVCGGQTKALNQELPIPVTFPFYYYCGPPLFDLEEESTIQPSRHTHAAAGAQLEWSANILSIKVVSSAVDYPINLYGSVFVRDDLDRKRVYLFRRDRNNSQIIKSPEEALVLTGPSRGLLVFDNLFFESDLKVRCDEDDMDFSQGKMHYSNHATVRSLCIVSKLTTKFSTIKIAYAPVQSAVEASVQIKVPKGFSIEFGKIAALITGIEEEVILFDSDTSGAIKIGHDGIELRRSIVSVPIDGSLLLRVDTWEGDHKAKLSGSGAVFVPQLCGEDVVTVHSAMQVKVTWSPVYISELDDKLLHNVIF